MREFFRFPDPVNEWSARFVAGGVVLLCFLALVAQAQRLIAVIAGGFVLRVLFGPRVSPLALLVTKVIVPRLPMDERPTPGPPKRFAQGMGAVMSLTAAVFAFVLGWDAAAFGLVAMILVAASLESIFGLCIGCHIFAVLMRAGIIPESVCEACADISRRRMPAS